MSKPFLIFALPRSMTAWCSCFLTVGDCYCLHETPMTTEQIVAFMRTSPFGFTGIAAPNLILNWRELTAALSDAKILYLRRPAHQSQKALAAAGGVTAESIEVGFQGLLAKVDDFIQHAEPQIIDWKELGTAEGMVKLWRAVTGGIQLPATHAHKMLSLHIQQKSELIQAACGNSGATTKN